MEDLQRALASHGLLLSSLPEKGRSLFATKDFSPGDVIICQEPYASVPSTSVEPRCDGCFVSGNLKKCSACRVAWYCGSTCQKSEWKLHQLECQALVNLSKDRLKKLTPTIRLMAKLFLRRKLQSEKVIPTTATDNYNLVEALVAHMSDIDEKQLVLYAQMSNLVQLVLQFPEISIKEIVENFSKLACNAHSICDSDIRPLGTGLYPVISIINHSCLPNSLLVFEGRLGVVRAVEPIARGTEVLINYIEIAASTTTRQKALREQYYFTCMCPRCVKVGSVEDLQETAILDGYRCKDKKCDGFLLLNPDDKIFVCQQCGLSRNQQEIERVAKEVKEVSGKASMSLSAGNYCEASAMYKTIEQLQLKFCHSYSVSLMQTREVLLKILLELKDWKGALTCCRLTISFYQRVYPAMHPLLGLQYYTCGKLEWLLGDTEDSLQSFTKAVDVLRITHGASARIVRDILSQLEEARAEAVYKVKQPLIDRII